MEKELSTTPNYYAIIKASVRYDERLKPMEKLLYGEINALANYKGYCYAQNGYFAKLYGVTKGTVSTWINSLIKYEHLTSKVFYKEGTKEIIERRLYIVNFDDTLPLKKTIPYNEKEYNPITKNRKDNNTSNNTTSINNTLSDDNVSIHKKVIDYLNDKTSKSFKPNSATTKKSINARLNEGFTENDFYHVIDVMTEKWINDKNMSQYLRPQTLFGNKFESYLQNQKKYNATEDNSIISKHGRVY